MVAQSVERLNGRFTIRRTHCDSNADISLSGVVATRLGSLRAQQWQQAANPLCNQCRISPAARQSRAATRMGRRPAEATSADTAGVPRPRPMSADMGNRASRTPLGSNAQATRAGTGQRTSVSVMLKCPCPMNHSCVSPHSWHRIFIFCSGMPAKVCSSVRIPLFTSCPVFGQLKTIIQLMRGLTCCVLDQYAGSPLGQYDSCATHNGVAPCDAVALRQWHAPAPFVPRPLPSAL